MFLVIAQNGKQYGPFPPEQVKEWIEKGWLNKKSKIKDETEADWKTIAENSLFASLVASAPKKEAPKQKETSQTPQKTAPSSPKKQEQPPKVEKIEKVEKPEQKENIVVPEITHTETPSPIIEEATPSVPKDTFCYIPLAIAGWSTPAVLGILFGVTSIFWKGALSILAIVFGHYAYVDIGRSPERKSRVLAFGSFALGYITLGLLLFNIFTITIPSLKDAKENLRRINVIQESIDQFGPTTQEYQCWNASGLKISFVDGVILNPSETKRVVDAISKLQSFTSANIPSKELTASNLILMRIGHDHGSYAWRVVCYRRNPKGYGVDRKGRSMKPEAFEELRKIY